jgi:hypothetical protein
MHIYSTPNPSKIISRPIDPSHQSAKVLLLKVQEGSKRGLSNKIYFSYRFSTGWASICRKVPVCVMCMSRNSVENFKANCSPGGKLHITLEHRPSSGGKSNLLKLGRGYSIGSPPDYYI